MVKWDDLMYDKEVTELIYPYIDKVVKRPQEKHTNSLKNHNNYDVNTLIKSIKNILLRYLD